MVAGDEDVVMAKCRLRPPCSVTRRPLLPRDHMDVRGRILTELRANVAALAADLRPVGPGWIVRTPSLPLVWTLNQLRITKPSSIRQVIDLAERYQAELPYRHVVVEDDGTASQLRDALSPDGWRVDREVMMALKVGADRSVDAASVMELSEAQMLHLMRRWRTEEHPGISCDALDQLDTYSLNEGRLWEEVCFGVLDVNGDPVALTKLRSRGSCAWVEDVYTVPEARGRGYARMLVGHTADLARSDMYDLSFIIADDDDWPKDLYASIGFAPVGRTRTFHLDLGAAQVATA
jgi:GNAT superfamily N-acetyltransferase